MISSGDCDYDAVLARVAEIQEEQRLTNPFRSQRPGVPANFSVEVRGYRLYVMFERIGDQFLGTSA